MGGGGSIDNDNDDDDVDVVANADVNEEALFLCKIVLDDEVFKNTKPITATNNQKPQLSSARTDPV